MPLHPYIVKTSLHKLILFFTRPFSFVYEYMTYLKWVDKNRKSGIINDYYTTKSHYQNRFKLHEAIIEHEKLDIKPINYLEFGVAKGDMIKYWVEKNNNESSTFVGFDSFEGLPESWENKAKGHFDTGGNFPQIEDARVTFIKGWFQDTLYDYIKGKGFDHQTIFHLDADIFSSTLYVLFQIHALFKAGDILIFDEFSSHQDEYKAFELFKLCDGKKFEYEFLGGINNFRQTAFKIK